jgi:cyclic 2,3-diphosphoglycerate synthetase
VIEAALEEVRARGHEVVGGIVAGGTEKLPSGGRIELRGVELRAGGDPRSLLHEAIVDLAPEGVLDLSDEPVLDYRRRHQMISVALNLGVPYDGADFGFRPPPRPRVAKMPSLAIIGTGKRTGKTAVAGFAARTLTEAGFSPGIVAMGRGGPPDPEVLHGEEVELEPRDLLELADQGKHAASDYIEDALLGRVPTVGCRRCGGGLAGGVEVSNVPQGVEMMNELGPDMVLLEGSGSAIPPVHADSTGLVIPANVPLEYLTGYLGPYRLLLADFVVVTMCENPFGSSSQISAIVSHVHDAWRPTGEHPEPADEIQVVCTVFRPHPVRSVEGADAFVATTAPEAAAEGIRRHLETEHGCKVRGMTHSLSDRGKLERELAAAKGEADVLLCEIKAAGVDVATRKGLEEGMEVIYMDNVPHGIEGHDPKGAIERAGQLAYERFEKEKV